MNAPADLSALRIDRSARPSRGGSRSPLLLVIAVAVIAIAAVLWFRARNAAVAVKTGTVTVSGGGAASADGISANGYVVARTKASVSSKVLGRLAWIGVTEGSHMKAGDVIARLEDADYAAAAASAKAQVASVSASLAQAQRALQRAKTLQAQNLVPTAQLEDAQTTVDVLAAQLATARAQADQASAALENTRVRAPFAGTVLRKDAEVGEIVAPSSAGGGLTRTAIVTMADLTTLEVEVDVNEAYIAQVRNGQDARITLDAYPDTSFTGKVRQVVPTADRQKATVLVKVAILDHDPRILSEMGARVVFLAKGADTAAAPRRTYAPTAAIVRTGDAAHVWVVENGAVREQAVDVGPEKDGQIEVRKGLSGGESLVLDPPASLKAGVRVKATER